MPVEKFKNISAAILCGGKNRRMDSKNKAFLPVENIPIIERQLNVLESIFKEIIIVTNKPDDYSQYQKKCRIITDIFKDIGPLGGIHTALSQTQANSVFFIACDMPFLHNEIIVEQIAYFKKNNCEALAPKINGFIEPLHAVYKKTLVKKLENFINNSQHYAVKNFLETINTIYWDLSDKNISIDVFKNINTLEDLCR